MNRLVSSVFRPGLSRSFYGSFRWASSGKRYTETHEWIEVDSKGIGVVGISNVAQERLGEIVYANLPDVGADAPQGQSIAEVESVKACSAIYSPVDGTVTEVNTELDGNPSTINEAAESSGWLFKISLKTPSQVDSLLTESQYKEHCEKH